MTEEQEELSRRYSNVTDDGVMGLDSISPEPKKLMDRWTGKVVQVKDPIMMGRVKVKIFGHYDDVPEQALPWALPEKSYVGSSTANLVVPPVDAVVRGYFENGDPYKPIYDGIVSSDSPVDLAAKAFSSAVGVGNSILNDVVSDYPNTMVLMQTDEGEGVTLNRSNGTMKITHRSGLKIQIDPNGSILVEQSMSKKIDQPEPASMEVKVEGKFSLEANDDITINAKRNVYIDSVLGDVNLGKNNLKTLVCAHPECFVTGAPTNGGNTNVKA